MEQVWKCVLIVLIVLIIICCAICLYFGIMKWPSDHLTGHSGHSGQSDGSDVSYSGLGVFGKYGFAHPGLERPDIIGSQYYYAPGVEVPWYYNRGYGHGYLPGRDNNARFNCFDRCRGREEDDNCMKTCQSLYM